MPNMNGVDLLTRIRSYRADLPVIVFTGYRDALATHLANLSSKVLIKPMCRQGILDAIDEVLN